VTVNVRIGLGIVSVIVVLAILCRLAVPVKLHVSVLYVPGLYVAVFSSCSAVTLPTWPPSGRFTPMIESNGRRVRTARRTSD